MGSMVLNTFRRAARKQLQQEVAGKSCLESPQGQFGNWERHGPWKIARKACDENVFLGRRWFGRAQQLCQHRTKKGKLNAPLIGSSWALIGKLVH